MRYNVYYSNTLKYITFICFFILFISLYNVLFPNIAYAQSPDEITNYYGSVEYMGKDAYGHFHNPRPQPTYTPYRPLGTVENRAELEGSLGLLTQHPICELNAMSMEGTVSTEIFDRELFNNRYESMKEYVKTYHLDENNSFFKNVGIVYQTVNENLTFIYIKATTLTKRKIYWTIWARDRGKYNSYNEFKKTWNSNTGFWSRLERSVKGDISREVNYILGVDKIERQLKKSVLKEVEKALLKNNPFRM